MSYFIDTHTHLFSEQFAYDIDAVVQNALSQGVQKMVLPNIDSETINAMLALSEKYPKNCFPTIGLHPCHVKENFEEELQIVADYLQKYPNFCAIGEMGTDLHWDKTFWEQQKIAFKYQVELAKKYDLPIIIHCRESVNETLEMLSTLQDGTLRGVFHCFTGSTQTAEKIIQLGGFMMGIGGVATYKKSGLDEVLPHIPLEYLVLETDSPYLSPTPYRGKRNESAYIPFIAQKLADFKGISIQKLQEITTRNAERLFRI